MTGRLALLLFAVRASLIPATAEDITLTPGAHVSAVTAYAVGDAPSIRAESGFRNEIWAVIAAAPKPTLQTPTSAIVLPPPVLKDNGGIYRETNFDLDLLAYNYTRPPDNPAAPGDTFNPSLTGSVGEELRSYRNSRARHHRTEASCFTDQVSRRARARQPGLISGFCSIRKLRTQTRRCGARKFSGKISAR